MTKLVIYSSFLAIALCFSGCAGYKVGDVKPSAYSGINRIFVPNFANQTLEPRISNLITNAVIKELQLDGTYQISRRQDADAILVGSIESIKKRNLRSSRTDTTRSQELSLTIKAKYHFEDLSGNKITTAPSLEDESSTTPEVVENIEQEKIEQEVIRASPGIVNGTTIQFVDPSFQVGERNAVAVAAEDLAKNLVDQLSEGW